MNALLNPSDPSKGQYADIPVVKANYDRDTSVPGQRKAVPMVCQVHSCGMSAPKLPLLTLTLHIAVHSWQAMHLGKFRSLTWGLKTQRPVPVVLQPRHTFAGGT